MLVAAHIKKDYHSSSPNVRYRTEGIDNRVPLATRKGESMTVLVNEITFYKVDDDGNEILNSITGEVQIFKLKQGVRFKPLEYLVDDVDEDILEEE